MNITQLYETFPTQLHCIEYLEKVKWKGVPACPYCQSIKSSEFKTEQRYHCNACNTSYSVTVNTIFHNTKLELQKWFLAITLILNAKKGLSSRQLSRDLGVHKNTAWSMGMRIRKAMLNDGELLTGIIEMDETYVGGKPRKGADRGPTNKNKRGRGTKKTPVVGMVERNGNVKAFVSHKLSSKKLMGLIRRNIDYKNSTLMTDEFKGYIPVSKIMPHKIITHDYEYVNGIIHTNTIESFWAIVKRGIIGQYHKVSKKYLQKYIDEFCFRYNNRRNNNVFDLAISRAVTI